MGRASIDRANRRKISFWKIAGQRELPDKTKVVDCRLLSKKKDGTFEEERGLSGIFISIGHGEFTYKERLNKTIIINFWDKEEFQVEMGIDSQLGRDLCNVILSRNDINFIEISCYHSKPNAENVIFPRIGVRVNKEKDNLGWKHDYKTVLAPKIKKVMFRNKEESDTSLANDFLLEDWIRHEKVLNAHAETIPANIAYEKSKGEAPAPDTGSGRPAAEEKDLQKELDGIKSEDLVDHSRDYPEHYDNSVTDDLPF